MLSVPFRGNKRNWVKAISQLVKANHYTSVAEPFGGSGILTVNLADQGLLTDGGTINDYDHYFDDYDAIIAIKESLIERLESRGYHKDSEHRLPKAGEKLLQDAVSQYDDRTRMKIRNNFCYGGFHWEVSDFTYFRGNTDMGKERAYLAKYREQTIVHLDWQAFFQAIVPKMPGKPLLFVDPPYVAMDASAYHGTFDRDDLAKLIQVIATYRVDTVLFEGNDALVSPILVANDLSYTTMTRVFGQYTNANGQKKRTDYAYVIRFGVTNKTD